MLANDWRREVRLSPGFAGNLADLYQAADVDQLRDRLSDGLANLGFWGVCDCVSALRVDATYFDSRRHNWDNLAGPLGARRDELLRGLFETGAAAGHEEENRRLRWRAAQRQPYLTIADAPARFRAHEDFLRVYHDFGLRAADTLVMPLPQDRSGLRRIWAVAEQKADLHNTAEVAQLLAVYHLKAQLWRGDDSDDGDEEEVGVEALPCEPSEAAPGCDETVILTDTQREVLRWAAAGKTLQDIAIITGLSYRMVRYHMDKARSGYGFATTQQTIVRAALDYGFDPLGQG